MRRLPLRLIVIVLLVPLVAAASLGTVAFQVYRQETRRLVSERDERAVRAAAVGLTERVYNQAMALRTLSDRLSDGVPFQQLVSESDFLFNQFDGGVAFYDPLPSKEGLRGRINLKIQDRPCFSSKLVYRLTAGLKEAKNAQGTGWY